jgi:hypothetical protein
MVELQRQALSPDNPWPGLDPFDETDRDYFHGRTAESGELLRQVRRELLTMLFGRSGLGKTSLLKAGLFPRLRGEDCLPVYVRLDHGAGAPTLREQVFRELQAACTADRVQAAQPAGDESLWSFFHRRDAEFWSERNRPVTPVLVFDQFEEIFTLGQESEASRARSVAFLAELGDLVENRPPEAVRQALEAEPTTARRFDFKRSTVKLVLSFLEDFLAEIGGDLPNAAAMLAATVYYGVHATRYRNRRGWKRSLWRENPCPRAQRSLFLSVKRTRFSRCRWSSRPSSWSPSPKPTEARPSPQTS